MALQETVFSDGGTLLEQNDGKNRIWINPVATYGAFEPVILFSVHKGKEEVGEIFLEAGEIDQLTQGLATAKAGLVR